MIKLYNTASRKIETFKPLGKVVKIYTCGPTVYSYPHIGNHAAYTYWDLLVRMLKANNYEVNRVLNLTDVGHLVSDADEGEDKLEKGARREGKTAFEIAEHYIKVYLDDYEKMNFLPPEQLARATDFIQEDIEAVKTMTEKGFTYETEDGIYYDTSKFPGYGDFARLDLEGLQAGARVSFNLEKRNVSDFAVWKFCRPGEKRAMKWSYLGREGFPGWHLECSTIIHELLGEPIDIHTGGIDHIPIHHTNEIAQTYAISGHELAKYWLHCEFITIDGKKISKSLGNTYTLADLESRGFSAMDYKMWLLSGHYQGTRNFTFEGLESARNRRLNWRNRVARCYQKEVSGESKVFSRILEAVNDNLNSAEAFKIIDSSELSLSDWVKVDELFGLRLIEDTPDIAEDLYALISEREVARSRGDFGRADEIREELGNKGIKLEDTADGVVWGYLK